MELSRPWQVIARVGWIATALLTLGLFAASLPARYDELVHPDLRANQTLLALHLPGTLFAGYTLALEILVALVFSFVGGIISGARPMMPWRWWSPSCCCWPGRPCAPSSRPWTH